MKFLRNLFNRLRPSRVQAPPAKTDDDWLAEGCCPDCHEAALLCGPTGGAAMNVVCNNCHSEFNIALMMGCTVLLDRMGKLSAGRAGLYGITPDEYAAKALARQKETTNG